jgi:anthranilate phosphoribosyltransferase
MSSRSGAADVLEALGVDIEMTPDRAARAMREAGIAFLFAQTYHPAMKYAAAVRRALGFRTIFNLLGPICSPARVTQQLVGVYSREWLVPLAHALRDLGAERAWVVHGKDGLDEITTTTTTSVAALEDGKVTEFEISLEQVGLKQSAPESLRGGSAEQNATALRRLLDGESGPYRDIVLLNSAAALVVGGRAAKLADGMTLAAESIDRGRARLALDKLVALSGHAP